MRVTIGIGRRSLPKPLSLLRFKAVALDPSYPLAHAALADAWSALGYDGKAVEEARKAYQLAESLSAEDKRSVEGRYRAMTRDWKKAIEVYHSLVALYPDNLDYQLRLAAAQTSGAKAREALATLDSLRALAAPAGKDPRIDVEAANAWHALGDFKHMEEALESAATNAQAFGDQLLLAQARSQQCFAWRFLGKQENAIAACREAQRIYSASGDRGGEADTLRRLGDVLSDSDVAVSRPLSPYPNVWWVCD